MGVSDIVAEWTIVQLSLLGINPDLGPLSGTYVLSRQGGMMLKMVESHEDHLWNVVLNDVRMATGRELIGSILVF